MYQDWYIVKKGFISGSELLTPGTPVYTKEWRNTRSLEDAGYIRQPNCEADIEKIRAVSETLGENDEPTETKKGPDIDPARRGRKPKNGGE